MFVSLFIYVCVVLAVDARRSPANATDDCAHVGDTCTRCTKHATVRPPCSARLQCYWCAATKLCDSALHANGNCTYSEAYWNSCECTVPRRATVTRVLQWPPAG